MQPTPRSATHFKLALTVDNVIFGFDGNGLNVLLVKRTEPPYRRTWALPGDFVGERESLPAAARRVLAGFTGQGEGRLKQIQTFGDPDRHALGRVVTTAYSCLIRTDDFAPRTDGLRRKVRWHELRQVGELAFDHREILDRALDQLRDDVRYGPAAFYLLPEEFPLSQLQRLYEAVWGIELEKRNFRKKVLGTRLLTDLGRMQENVAHRPARLYRFDAAAYAAMRREGLRLQL